VLFLLLHRAIPKKRSRPMTHSSSGMIGKPALGFTLPGQEGNIHNLSDYKGKSVVLYGYPKDDTPGFVFTHET